MSYGNTNSTNLRKLLNLLNISWHSGALNDPNITYWESRGVEWCSIESQDGSLVVTLNGRPSLQNIIEATVGGLDKIDPTIKKEFIC